MAYTKAIRELEERRAALVEKNDRLRRELADRGAEFCEASLWVSHGFELGQRLFRQRRIVGKVLGLFRR